ncbi:MAG: hypothetical protein KAS99_02425 [Candidatus Omnitrophica bacterium]|nr:hypothetical protein [Candidatus Omnitrophota bacterium]
MKDIFGKITFGFFMAQFVPGAICVLGIGILFIHSPEIGRLTLLAAFQESLNFWTLSTITKLIFLTLSIGAGMAIHGLHWAVLGFLETFNLKDDKKNKSISETFWHNWPIFLQVLVGPIKIILEVLAFFFLGKGIDSVSIEENVPDISKDKMGAFQFIEDFYLHFAQFYAHTSYALLIALITSTIVCIKFNFVKCGIIILIYLFCGLFFIIGRIQLTALFKAENELKETT